MAREVTIVVLIILAGITLNAVIGEGGIIFQARDTRNKISNETTYDNAQLAQLQNELKDNGLYSGIGIIPGTDNGGGSEGGENGTSGGDQGGKQNLNSNTGGRPVQNTGNNSSGGVVPGETAQDPSIKVLEGEEIAASFYQTNVTIQIYTPDRTQKIKFILNTDVTEITNALYPSGLVRELDIENGGTLTFTKDGEYTITTYAYDTSGNKSNATVMWFKKQSKGETTTGGITVTIASGKVGLNDYYTSNVTLRVLGTDSGSSMVKYRVQGEATSGGQIGNFERDAAGAVDTGEQIIANGTTFRITMDGNFTIQAFSYDAGENLINPSEVVRIKKDSTRPVVRNFTGEQVVGSGFRVKIDAVDVGSGLVATPYVYRHRMAETNGEYASSEATQNAFYMFSGLTQSKSYDIYATITDLAGNVTVTKPISKPALWISRCSIYGDNEGNEGARRYCGDNAIEITLRGQDSTNVEIAKTTLNITGKVLDYESDGSNGRIGINEFGKGSDVNYSVEMDSGDQKSVVIAANGDWNVSAVNYDSLGNIITKNTILVARDTIPPVIEGVTKGTASFRGQVFTISSVKNGWSGLLSSGNLICYTNRRYASSGNFPEVKGKVANGNAEFTIRAISKCGIYGNELTSSGTYTTLASLNVRKFLQD